MVLYKSSYLHHILKVTGKPMQLVVIELNKSMFRGLQLVTIMCNQAECTYTNGLQSLHYLFKPCFLRNVEIACSPRKCRVWSIPLYTIQSSTYSRITFSQELIFPNISI